MVWVITAAWKASDVYVSLVEALDGGDDVQSLTDQSQETCRGESLGLFVVPDIPPGGHVPTTCFHRELCYSLRSEVQGGPLAWPPGECSGS